jgi:hypothetical protein
MNLLKTYLFLIQNVIILARHVLVQIKISVYHVGVTPGICLGKQQAVDKLALLHVILDILPTEILIKFAKGVILCA